MSIFRGRPMKIGLVALLVPVLFASILHGVQPGPSVILSAPDLSGFLGAGFWSDPCSWDGFGTGIGLVMCGAGNLGGCAGALYSVLRAIKSDHCF